MDTLPPAGQWVEHSLFVLLLIAIIKGAMQAKTSSFGWVPYFLLSDALAKIEKLDSTLDSAVRTNEFQAKRIDELVTINDMLEGDRARLQTQLDAERTSGTPERDGSKRRT